MRRDSGRQNAGRLAAGVLLLAAACGRKEPEAPAAPATHPLRAFWAAHDAAKDHYAAGRLEEALAGYERALSQNPDHPGSLYAAAHVDLLLGRHEPALRHLERLKRADPGETKAWLLAAVVLSDPVPGAPFDLARAAAEADAAFRMNAEDSGPATLQGRLALLAGAESRARERLDVARRANPRNAEALTLLGLLDILAGAPAAASAAFSAAEEAARGAPLPAGVASEGDTRVGGAGAAHAWSRHARWLRSLLPGGDGGTTTAAPIAVVRTRIEVLAESGFSGTALAAPDLDGDGDADVVAGSLSGPAVFFRNDGGVLSRVAAPGPDGLSCLAAGDLDGDGLPEIWGATGAAFAPSRPVLLRNRGGFRFDADILPGPPRRVAGTAILDADGDGRPELLDFGPPVPPLQSLRIWSLAPGREDGPLSVEGDDGVAITGLTVAGAPGAASGILVTAADGKLRVLLTGPRPRLSFASAPASLVVAFDSGKTGAGTVLAVDPAEPDLVHRFLLSGSPGPRSLALLRPGAGDVALRPAPGAPPLAAGSTAAAAGDLDGDGRIDVVLGCGGPEPWRVEPLWILRNAGGSFEAARIDPDDLPAAARRLPRASALAAADFDGDGRDEIIVISGGLLPGHDGPLLRLALR